MFASVAQQCQSHAWAPLESCNAASYGALTPNGCVSWVSRYEMYSLVPWRSDKWKPGLYLGVGSFYATTDPEGHVYCELCRSVDYGRTWDRVAPHQVGISQPSPALCIPLPRRCPQCILSFLSVLMNILGSGDPFICSHLSSSVPTGRSIRTRATLPPR